MHTVFENYNQFSSYFIKIKNNKKEIFYYTKNFNKFNSNLSERCYAIINNLEDRPKCHCGNYVNYCNGGKYSTFCCNKCIGDY